MSADCLERFRIGVAGNLGEDFSVLNIFSVDDLIVIGDDLALRAVIEDTSWEDVPVSNSIPLEVGKEV